MKVIYVAGPFRGKTPWAIEQNVRRAEGAALWLWQEGFAVICPHTMTRHYQDSAPDVVWLEGTLELMRRCDAVFVLSRWESSAGTLGEIAEAKRLGLPVIYDSFDALPLLLKLLRLSEPDSPQK